MTLVMRAVTKRRGGQLLRYRMMAQGSSHNIVDLLVCGSIQLDIIVLFNRKAYRINYLLGPVGEILRGRINQIPTTITANASDCIRDQH